MPLFAVISFGGSENTLKSITVESDTRIEVIIIAITAIANTD